MYIIYNIYILWPYMIMMMMMVMMVMMMMMTTTKFSGILVWCRWRLRCFFQP